MSWATERPRQRQGWTPGHLPSVGVAATVTHACPSPGLPPTLAAPRTPPSTGPAVPKPAAIHPRTDPQRQNTRTPLLHCRGPSLLSGVTRKSRSQPGNVPSLGDPTTSPSHSPAWAPEPYRATPSPHHIHQTASGSTAAPRPLPVRGPQVTRLRQRRCGVGTGVNLPETAASDAVSHRLVSQRLRGPAGENRGRVSGGRSLHAGARQDHVAVWGETARPRGLARGGRQPKGFRTTNP